jgi:hypothetical protein
MRLEASTGFSELAVVTLNLIVFAEHVRNRRLIIITPSTVGGDAHTLHMPFDEYARNTLKCEYHVQPRQLADNGTAPARPRRQQMLSRVMFCETEPTDVKASAVQLMKLRMLMNPNWLNRLCTCYT